MFLPGGRNLCISPKLLGRHSTDCETRTATFDVGLGESLKEVRENNKKQENGGKMRTEKRNNFIGELLVVIIALVVFFTPMLCRMTINPNF